MNTLELVIKKRDGLELTETEIKELIQGYVDEKVPDYQMSAFLMACYFNGLSKNETFYMTEVMMRSGKMLDLSDILGTKVDKHSTGGVGDKISLISGPIAAAAGVRVPKMSGRGLGFTGGTIDKLESIPGFKTNLRTVEFINIVNRNNIAIMGQSEDIAKADKVIYALRDVTGTVACKGLIASSVMSKKLACGSNAIVLDVKYGNGAFMATKKEAEELAELMKEIGTMAGRKVDYVLSDMNQPLGVEVGNANEVIEAIETLKGNGPEDLTKEAIIIAGKMIFLGGKASSEDEGKVLAKELIENGKALEKMKKFIESQGGNPEVCVNYTLLPQPKMFKEVYGRDIGINKISKIDQLKAMTVGQASRLAGAGRLTKNEKLDLSAGISLYKKVGDEVSSEDLVARIYSSDEKKMNAAFEELKKAYVCH